MDRRRLILVLEQSLTVMLSQAMLCFSDPDYADRDKQLLKRELGAELSSFTESMRRHMFRGNTAASSRSPQLGGGGGGGSSPSGSGSGSLLNASLNKSDEQFMKFISSVVHNVFK